MIKLLIVDDSETEIQLLKHIFSIDKEIKVVGVAKNGKECIELAKSLMPDIITMDIQMPIMDGLEATKIIMSTNPIPIIVISSRLKNSEVNLSFRALEAGALSVLDKPKNINSPSFDIEKQKLINAVHTMAEIKMVTRRFHHVHPSLFEPKLLPHSRNIIANYEIIAIGSSVGGPQALKLILSKLPADFPLPITIVQHMTQGFIEGFVNWLNDNILLHAKLAEQNEILVKGNVYFAPDSHHLKINRFNGNLIAQLNKTPPVAGFCPSITTLFHSIARTSQANAIGVLLTGMGTDGAEGLLAMKNARAHTITQDKESAVVFGMAGVATDLGAVDKAVELNQIANYLIELAKSSPQPLVNISP